jgi:hypothetical protein
MPPASTNFVPFIIVAFILWRVFYRVRRSVGRQTVQRKRLNVRIIIYSLLCGFLILDTMAHPKTVAGLTGGLLLGVPLGLLGLRLTRFETTPEGCFYTPNPYLGVTITILFIVRLFYRLTEVFVVSSRAHQRPVLTQTPLTLSLFGLLAGYYIAYYMGVLQRSRHA